MGNDHDHVHTDEGTTTTTPASSAPRARKRKKSKRPTYEKVKTHVKATNSVTINSVSIAGEAVGGLFSIFVMLKTLRLHYENDTYHPFLFHYMVGVSIGSVVICLMLNSMYLYETQGRKIALAYLDAVYAFIDFDSLRSVFYDADGSEGVRLTNPLVILKNLYNDGSFCSREALRGLLVGNHKDFAFDNRRQYFVSKEFKSWLDDTGRLYNVFIVCYSAQQTKMVTFTGNENRFNSGINFIVYKVLNHSNLLHAIICSSDIPLLYPVESVDGTNFATDGASAERNQSCYLQMLINCTYYFSSNKIYGKMLDFFGVTTANDNFLIMHNKLNLQQSFEDLEEFDISFVPIVRSVQTLSTFFRRVYYNATMNVPLMSLFLQQPYIRPFSTLNINDIVLTSYKQRQVNLLRNIDAIKDVTFKSHIPLYYDSCKPSKKYHKYNPITSNQLISTFLYSYNPPESIVLVDQDGEPLPDEPTINVNIAYFDMNIRNIYKLDDLVSLYLLFDFRSDYIVENILNTKKMAVVSANMLYEISKRQGLATFDKSSTARCDNHDLFDRIYSLGPDVIDVSYEEFLGQTQS